MPLTRCTPASPPLFSPCLEVDLRGRGRSGPAGSPGGADAGVVIVPAGGSDSAAGVVSSLAHHETLAAEAPSAEEGGPARLHHPLDHALKADTPEDHATGRRTAAKQNSLSR